MDTLHTATRIEKLVGAMADLTNDFPLAYDAVSDTIPRDTPAELSPVHYLICPLDYTPQPDTILLEARRDPARELPLVEWIEAEASWYDQCEQEGSELIAAAIRRIRYSATAYEARTPSELIARSPHFARAGLETVATPAERHSFLADLIDREVEGYLLENSELARLVAWQLLQLADEAEHYVAHSEHEFLAARQQAEAEAYDAMMDDDDNR